MRRGAERGRMPWAGCEDASGADPCEAAVYAIVTLHGGEKRRACLGHAIELEQAEMLQAARRVVE
jgi:hypothetical protein